VQVITGNLGTNALGSINIGSDNAGTAYFTGDMAEILLYNSAVSTANISALQAYFHNKYGI
jgi:hypothetical protein